MCTLYSVNLQRRRKGLFEIGLGWRAIDDREGNVRCIPSQSQLARREENSRIYKFTFALVSDISVTSGNYIGKGSGRIACLQMITLINNIKLRRHKICRESELFRITCGLVRRGCPARQHCTLRENITKTHCYLTQ